MIVHEMLQRTPEWFEIRKGKITGTDASKTKETIVLELLSQITEDFEEYETYLSSDMQRGLDLEPFALDALSSEIFIEFHQVGFIQNASIPILGISPDGISTCQTIQCEIKCPGAKKHISTIIADEIPIDNIDQCIHAFVVNPKLERLYFASFRPESNVKKLWYKELTLNSTVNIGTKARPVMNTIKKIVEIRRQLAEEINKEINKSLISLSERYTDFKNNEILKNF